MEHFDQPRGERQKFQSFPNKCASHSQSIFCTNYTRVKHTWQDLFFLTWKHKITWNTQTPNMEQSLTEQESTRHRAHFGFWIVSVQWFQKRKLLRQLKANSYKRIGVTLATHSTLCEASNATSIARVRLDLWGFAMCLGRIRLSSQDPSTAHFRKDRTSRKKENQISALSFCSAVNVFLS